MRAEVASYIAIVGCGVHQGDGTATILADTPEIFTRSLHGAKNFLPQTGERPRRRTARRHRRRAYLAALDAALDTVFTRARPSW